MDSRSRRRQFCKHRSSIAAVCISRKIRKKPGHYKKFGLISRKLEKKGKIIAFRDQIVYLIRLTNLEKVWQLYYPNTYRQLFDKAHDVSNVSYILLFRLYRSALPPADNPSDV
jgi:hypothetical protein